MPASLADLQLEPLNGGSIPFADFDGKVLLIVNTASACGLTPHYAGLEELHQQYHERGLAVLGFPCNQFAAQEPGDAAEIASFCERNYHISFPLFAKTEVNGADSHPLYRFLKSQAANADGSADIPWNFTKFLVSRDRTQVERFAPTTAPADLAAAIEALL